MEIWKDIVGYEGLYQVSNLGNVKSLERRQKIKIKGKECLRHQKEKIMKQWKRSNYLLVDLWNEGRRDIRSVHRLVFETFNNQQIGEKFIHHKDENKFNNNIDNLELMKCKEHNKLHHAGKPSWNKGLHTGNQYTKKYKGVNKMDKEREVMSEFRLADEERQPCGIWTRTCNGLSSTCF